MKWPQWIEEEGNKEGNKRVQSNSPETSFHDMDFADPNFRHDRCLGKLLYCLNAVQLTTVRFHAGLSATDYSDPLQPSVRWNRGHLLVACLSHFFPTCFTEDPPFLHQWDNYIFLSFYLLLLSIQIFVSAWSISSDLSFSGHHVFSTFLSFLSYLSVGIHRIAQHLPDDRVTVDSSHVV
jgi:hypothetical protein